VKRINADKALNRAKAKLAKMSSVDKLALLEAMDIYVRNELDYELVHADLVEVWLDFEQRLGLYSEHVEHRNGDITRYWVIDDTPT